MAPRSRTTSTLKAERVSKLHSKPVDIAASTAVYSNTLGRSTLLNMAARVQSTSRPGEVVVSEEVAADPAVAPVLAGVQCEVVHAALKGIGEGLRLHRLCVV